MRRALAFLVAVVALAGAIAAFAPAALVDVVLERASDGALTLAGAEGTLWRGRGTLVAGRGLQLPLGWSIDVLPLVTAELRLRIASPANTGPTPTGEISLRRGAIAVRALEVTLPVNFPPATASRAGVRATGDLTVVSPSLEWTESSFAGSARVTWQEARVAMGDDIGTSLGNVDVALSASGARLTGPVKNDGGELDIRGTVSVSTRGGADLSLTLTPRRDDPALVRQLAAIGTPDGAGWRVELHTGPR